MNDYCSVSAGQSVRRTDEEPIRFLHSDPTASRAIGSLERELRQMRREAEQLRMLRRNNRLTPEQEERARRRFIGIYRPLFEKAMNG